IAAMFAASVLFVGCGDPEPTPTPKPNPNPNPGGDGVSLLTVDTEESWWQQKGGGATGEIEDFYVDGEDGYVQWTAKYGEEPDWDDPSKWYYAAAAFTFGKGVLTSGTKIVITYEAAGPTQLELGYEDGKDGNLTRADNFMAILPATDGKTLTLDLNKNGGFWTEGDMEGGWNGTSGNHFRIPAWVDEEGMDSWDLNLGNIDAFYFNTANNSGDGWFAENFVKITKLEVINGNWGE
ncbi:MAG: hypothetical protein FWF51_08915, partial [Chitinivibrionia bacterium]|nr:hypothetical protein [Chitinivibrionia bacterium]